MLEKLAAEVRGKVEPFVERWKKFEGKLIARAQEVEDEAQAGLNELIQINALDPNSISAGFNAVKNRVMGLGDKIEAAMEKLEGEWEEATEDLDLEEQVQNTLYRIWYGIVRESRVLQHKLEQWGNKIEIKKNADWARILYKMAEGECKKERQCPSCGAGIEVSIQHAHSAIKCPHCDSVNEMDIGMATGLYYQGNGVHSLAQEAAADKYMALQNAEHDFNEWRHPTDEDRDKYMAAAADYWTGYYQAYQKLHPGFSQTIEEAVKGRMAHYDQYDNVQDQTDRLFYGDLVRKAQARDRDSIREHLEGAEDPDEAPSAVHEHGDREGTIVVLQVLHEMQDEDEEIHEWIQEKLKELDEDLATR
jgi:phage FluMu protein Com